MAEDDLQLGLLCTAHGNKRPWYCVCLHVFNKQIPIARLDRPTIHKVGNALCKKCAARVTKLKAKDLKPVCDLCVEQELIPAVGLLLGAEEK